MGERIKSMTTMPYVQHLEWIRPNDVRAIFGIGRSTLYKLMDSGEIVCAPIHDKGKRQGIRLVSVESIRAYITSRIESH